MALMRGPAAVGLLLFTACATSERAPDLPAIQLEGFTPAVRSLVEQAVDVARKNPKDAAASGRLGMVLHAHEQFGAARTAYRRARTLDRKAFRWPYYLSAVESGLGNHEAALASLADALKIDPDYTAARLRRAEILFDQGKLEESAALYEAVTENMPTAAAAWYGLGRAQSGRGETEKAVASLRKACALFPQYGSAHYALAQSLRKMGSAEEAARHLASSERYKIFVPNSADPLMAEVQNLNISAAAYIRQASDLESQGRVAEAYQLHLKALETDPHSAQAHANLISLTARLNQPDKATEHYRKAIELNKNQADAHYNYGVLRFGRRQFAEAKAAFEKALEANPYFAEAHNNLGYLLETQGRAAEAERHYRAAIENLPGYRLAHFHLGRMLLARRNYKEAILHLEQTVTPEDNDTPGFLYALGAAYGRSGNTGRATEVLQLAREKAAARNQTQLIAGIDRDLQTLGGARPR
jgi:tetratricopeptide (TPR) repeat protein